MQVQQTATKAPSGALVFFSDGVTTVTNIKATNGQIYLLDLMNGTAATAYLQIFFKPASAVTLGTTVADWVIVLPTNGGSGFVKTIPLAVPVGGTGTGLSIAGTTTAAGATTASIKVSAEYV